MATIIHLNEFSREAYNQFIQDINDTELAENREIYLFSPGGVAWNIEPFKKIIEDRKIPIIAHTDIFSSALILILTTNTKITILDHTRGLFHYPYFPQATLLPNREVRYSDPTSETLSKDLFMDIDYFNDLLGISKKQQNKLMKGKDILYTAEELRKLVKKVQK